MPWSFAWQLRSFPPQRRLGPACIPVPRSVYRVSNLDNGRFLPGRPLRQNGNAHQQRERRNSSHFWEPSRTLLGRNASPVRNAARTGTGVYGRPSPTPTPIRCERQYTTPTRCESQYTPPSARNHSRPSSRTNTSMTAKATVMTDRWMS